MPLHEKQLAEDLVDLRQMEATGTGYCPIADLIAAKQLHLDREMLLRETVGGLIATIERMDGVTP